MVGQPCLGESDLWPNLPLATTCGSLARRLEKGAAPTNKTSPLNRATGFEFADLLSAPSRQAQGHERSARLARASIVVGHDVEVAPNPLDRILGLPADLAALLAHLPAIARNTEAIEEHTAPLDEVARSLRRVAEDTDVLPAVRDALLLVVETTANLNSMDERLASIEETMPVLVDVQKQLGELPPTMKRLDQGIERLCDLMERTVESIDGLGGQIETLQGSLEPVGRLASRVPGQSKQ